MKILQTLMSVILPLLKSAGVPVDILIEAAKAGADAFFDRIEDRIEETETQIDDVIVGNAIRIGRELIGIQETAGSKYEDT